MTLNFLLVLVLAVVMPACGGEYRDYRQTGTTNIHIDVKDVVILGMYGGLGEYSDESNDYAYDYADLTVKPETSSTSSDGTSVTNATTAVTISTTAVTPEPTGSLTSSKPAATTSKPDSTPSKPVSTTSARAPVANGSSIALQNNSIVLTNQNKENATDASKQPLNAENFQIPVMIVPDNGAKKGYVSSSSIRRKDDAAENPGLPGRKCLHGFYLDSRNRCKPISRKPVHNSKEKHRVLNGVKFAQRPTEAETSAN